MSRFSPVGVPSPRQNDAVACCQPPERKSSMGGGSRQLGQQQEFGSLTSLLVEGKGGDFSGDNGRIPVPSIEIKLFVGRIPKSYDETQIRNLFSSFGIVRDVTIIRDRESGQSRGCAFVRMASIRQADAAIRSVNHLRVLHPDLGALQVQYAAGEMERLGLPSDNTTTPSGHDQAKLFVGSIPRSATEDELFSLFARFGQVDEVFLMRDEHKQSKGCAFVRYCFKEEALNAITHLNGRYLISGGVRMLEVRFAENRKQPQPMTRACTFPTTTASSFSSSSPHNPPSVMIMMPRSSRNNPLVPSPQLGTVVQPPWVEYVTAEGRPYYYNASTGTTQWERPPVESSKGGAPGGPCLLAGARSTTTPGYPCVHQKRPQQGSSSFPNIVPGGVGAQTHGPPGANVFIFHVPNDWSEHDLVSHFSPFGQIVSARIATDKGNGRRLGFGFVSFSTIDASVKAVQRLDGLAVSGKRLRVTIKRGEEQYAAALLRASPTHPADLRVVSPHHHHRQAETLTPQID